MKIKFIIKFTDVELSMYRLMGKDYEKTLEIEEESSNLEFFKSIENANFFSELIHGESAEFSRNKNEVNIYIKSVANKIEVIEDEARFDYSTGYIPSNLENFEEIFNEYITIKKEYMCGLKDFETNLPKYKELKKEKYRIKMLEENEKEKEMEKNENKANRMAFLKNEAPYFIRVIFFTIIIPLISLFVKKHFIVFLLIVFVLGYLSGALLRRYTDRTCSYTFFDGDKSNLLDGLGGLGMVGLGVIGLIIGATF